MVRAGDTAAFEALYVRHVSEVSKTVAAIVRNREQTPDVAQEASSSTTPFPSRPSSSGASMFSVRGACPGSRISMR
jgi:hypothetical protein